MRKLLYGIYRLWMWLEETALRRITPAGMAVLAGWFVAAILGVDTDQTLAYQAFAFLFGLLLIAWVGTWGFRLQLRVRRQMPRFATVGTPLKYRVSVKNLGSRRQRGITLLENLGDNGLGFQDYLARQLAAERRVRSFAMSRETPRTPVRVAIPHEAPVPPLASHQELEIMAELLPQRRGVLRLEGVTLARTDPLGLFRTLRRIPLPDSLLVLPKRYLLPPITLPGTMRYQRGGVALASSVGQSEEFMSLREYRRGDPLRHLHWRSLAKTGKPIVKEFQDEFFVRHALLLDTFTDDPASVVFEEAVSVAASFACTIQTQESLLEVMFVGPEAYCLTAGRGLAHAEQLLEILASVQPCDDREVSALEALLWSHVELLSGVICVFITWDEPRRKLVERLASIGMPLLVLVITAPGAPRPDPGPMASSPGRFHVLPVGAIEENLARL